MLGPTRSRHQDKWGLARPSSQSCLGMVKPVKHVTNGGGLEIEGEWKNRAGRRMVPQVFRTCVGGFIVGSTRD